MVVRQHKIHVLTRDEELNNGAWPKRSHSSFDNNSNGNRSQSSEEVIQSESMERSTSHPNSNQTTFDSEQPYHVNGNLYSKSYFGERRTYDCDKNGELHIRIEPLAPSEALRPVSPVSPVHPVPDYAMDKYSKENELRPIYSSFSSDIKPFQHDADQKKHFEQKNRSILRSPSQLENMTIKIPRLQTYSSNKHLANVQKQQFAPKIKITSCACNECSDDYSSHKTNEEDECHKKNEAVYSQVFNNEELSQRPSIKEKQKPNGYSPRYRRHYTEQRRARTTSPHQEIINSRRSDKLWPTETAIGDKRNSPSTVDSGRSSAASSFSPASSMGSASYLSIFTPMKKVTRKSRLVSIHDGRPVSPFVTKVHYEPIFPEDQTGSGSDAENHFNKLRRQLHPKQKGIEETEITMNPLFITD